MEELSLYLTEHWKYGLLTLLLIVAANLQGRISEIKRTNRWLSEHSERLAKLWSDEMILEALENDE